MSILHIYRYPGVETGRILRKIRGVLPSILSIDSEFCFMVEVRDQLKSANDQNQLDVERERLLWLFTETFEPSNVREKIPFLSKSEVDNFQYIIEVGPRLAFSTAWSSNCLSMCSACGVSSVSRIERSRRYLICSSCHLNKEQLNYAASFLYDRMTECIYETPLASFDIGVLPAQTTIIPVMEEGKKALESLNTERGLGFDDWDLEFYTSLFKEKLCRNPTDVEIFDLGQSNSEHSRHWFFGGRMIIDGEEKKDTLFQMVKQTLPEASNSVIAFHDNSSAITGFVADVLQPKDPTTASSMELNKLLMHLILTAETHNFPSGVAPFSGAETGTGGRLRDVQATGRGAHTVAGISAYCVGNLYIPEHSLPWEPRCVSLEGVYPKNLASPLEIIVEASNGASDYGNKYGEPVVAGFARSFGQRLPNGERREWIKPIMFTAGIGLLDARHYQKGSPEVGMIVCKIGGPAYRIGMGGGAASSRVQSSTTADIHLDFNAVQRGDAEMENRMNRVIRACIELGDKNPIVSIHDQGAGGNGNVLKEIVDPLGAKIELRSIPVGDPTLSALEIWGAEYQENNAFLVRREDLDLVQRIAERENCCVSAVGVVTGDGRVVVNDSLTSTVPFDLPLSLVLGKMPQKSFSFNSPVKDFRPIEIPPGETFLSLLERVLRLLDVGSKRFLTNKVDRSVTGLVAQQQCVGPLHTPLSNVAVLAQSHFSTTGVAVAVGEQPIKGLINPAAQARMTVVESLSNLVFAKITQLSDAKASGNWMWAAKIDGEGAHIYEACSALRDSLLELGPSIDGGKDSLSMAARVGDEIVKAPGQITLTMYAPCEDITKTITPDFKSSEQSSRILFVDLGKGEMRLGGTAFSTVLAQLGDESPDLEDFSLFKRCFDTIQKCINLRLLQAGHDRSDGGLITMLLEMAFAGNCGIEVDLSAYIESKDVFAALFNEEAGFVFEVLPSDVATVIDHFVNAGVSCIDIGFTQPTKEIIVRNKGDEILKDSMVRLRDIWESTSFALERLQCNPYCVSQEQEGVSRRNGYKYKYSFEVSPTPKAFLERPLSRKHRVAVIRQEGSNGDREMLSAFYASGMDAWDVNMKDLLNGSLTLDIFRGVVFCGGFSYADVNDSAKGWTGVIKFNPLLLAQFEAFRDRNNTFSLGVCNGCQLMALLGWVPFPGLQLPIAVNNSVFYSEDKQTRFVHNTSSRFESRWSVVSVQKSPAHLLKGMEGSSLGVWVAHGEGRVIFPEPTHLDIVEQFDLAPLRYSSDDGSVTENYPENPNGSPRGIAALCSKDGRHLAMMPHPERCFLSWQLPDYHARKSSPEDLSAPWLRLFQNAQRFCEEENL